MDIEIKIGRCVDGSNAYPVPSNFTKASRNHATIRWHDGNVTIEDNGSSNGTYVNGRRMAHATIGINDTVWLGPVGDEKSHQLDLRKIFASFPSVKSVQNVSYAQEVRPTPSYRSEDQRTDYSMEIERLKRVYTNYHDELNKIQKKANTMSQLPRILISTIPALLGVVGLILFSDMTLRMVALSAGGVLSTLLGVLLGGGGSRREKIAEKIMDLQLKYKGEYRCPKCGKEYNLDMHWKKLQMEGRCPYGCGAQFVK